MKYIPRLGCSWAPPPAVDEVGHAACLIGFLMYVYVCMYVCIYIYIYIHTYTHICVYL